MTIENRRQLEVAREKLVELERLFDATREAPGKGNHARELTLRSLKARINQFKEEIAKFETRASPAGVEGQLP